MSPYETVVQASLARQGPSLTEALALADRWATVAPNDYRPHHYRGRALLGQGNFGKAADALQHAATLGTPENRRRLFWERFEALVKADRGAEARRVLDEAVADPGRDTSDLRALTVTRLDALVGRFRPPPVDSARLRRARARADSVVRNRPPAPPPEPTFEELYSAGDTAGARRALVRAETMMVGPPGSLSLPRYHPFDLSIVRSYLMLRDTARAEAILANVERPFDEHPFRFKILFAYDPPPWVGRAWLLSGDVAAARGRREQAARMYRRVVGLWEGGDADVQSVVTDARMKLAFLARR